MLNNWIYALIVVVDIIANDMKLSQLNVQAAETQLKSQTNYLLDPNDFWQNTNILVVMPMFSA